MQLELYMPYCGHWAPTKFTGNIKRIAVNNPDTDIIKRMNDC